ncbi:hypothetical protein [Alkalilimnicola sp. S0819]|uniref:hypothetical protein n=1 Tax=Alkalilimnicola sp. S0819 TaxID=2613922 RepID=UPI0012622A36|nr:hypothetical protein [Alkalilimnicola sp. S0819]KAB7619648.1 hypothetical protein F3N43_13175 [Alkalilimnicola sp. S0819]MPQ17586.1 hypothetical protein [Alkalilimnicola sp. S0819]
MDAVDAVVEEGGLKRWLRDLGALRLALLFMGLVVVVFAADPDVEPVRHGWRLITTGVIPALSPMVVMVILFDMLMARVLMSDTEGRRRARYRRILKTDGIVVALIVLSWMPFFLSLAP